MSASSCDCYRYYCWHAPGFRFPADACKYSIALSASPVGGNIGGWESCGLPSTSTCVIIGGCKSVFPLPLRAGPITFTYPRPPAPALPALPAPPPPDEDPGNPLNGNSIFDRLDRLIALVEYSSVVYNEYEVADDGCSDADAESVFIRRRFVNGGLIANSTSILRPRGLELACTCTSTGNASGAVMSLHPVCAVVLREVTEPCTL